MRSVRRRQLRRALLSCALIASIAAVIVVVGDGAGSQTPKLGVLSSSACPTPGSFSVCGPAVGAGPVIYPGAAPATLPLTFYNPLNVNLQVQTLKVTFTNSFPNGCDQTQFHVGGPGATTSGAMPVVTLIFSPHLTATPGSSNYSATLALADSHPSQNNCRGTALAMTYLATAQYTASTTTTLTGNPNPSAVGSAVMLTAAVSTATAGATTPQGSVTFSQCVSAPCTTPTPLATVALSSGSASYNTAPLMTAGNYYFQAVYNPPTTPPTNTNWSNSTGLLTQVVQGASCVNVPTSGATVITGTVSGNYEVKNNTAVWLEGGTITGNVTVDAKGQFTTSGGSVGGNVTSAGGPVALQGTSVGGNVQTTNASLGLGPKTTVAGNVQPTGGTVLCSSGTSAGAVHVGNHFQIQGLGGTTNPVTICNTQVAGNLQYTGNAAPATFGGSSGCTGNSVGGNFLVQSNTARVTIGGTGFGNTAAGNIQVSSNTLASGTYPPYSTLTNNTSTGGSCQLSGNTPGIVGKSNSAAKQNTCNATA